MKLKLHGWTGDRFPDVYATISGSKYVLTEEGYESQIYTSGDFWPTSSYTNRNTNFAVKVYWTVLGQGHFGNRQLELSVMRPYLCLQLIISLALLLCILLSDFGILFQSSNTTARILLHISTIILIASTVIQLHTRK